MARVNSEQRSVTVYSDLRLPATEIRAEFEEHALSVDFDAGVVSVGLEWVTEDPLNAQPYVSFLADIASLQGGQLVVGLPCKGVGPTRRIGVQWQAPHLENFATSPRRL